MIDILYVRPTRLCRRVVYRCWPILVLPGWGGVCLLPMPPGGVYACTRTEGGVYGYICHMCRWLANYAYIESLTMEFIVVVLKFLSFDCWPILALPG